jgi:tRNA uridine 5-carboxymethylaminomethyl modification enzyme
MFTSRAEYRLLLREDNADARLTPTGRRLGLVDDARWAHFERKQALLDGEAARLAGIVVRPGDVDEHCGLEPLSRETTAAALLRRPNVSYTALTGLERVGSGPFDKEIDAGEQELFEQIALSLETNARYAGYIARQTEEIERHRRNAKTDIPTDLDYAGVTGLSSEVREQLMRIRPDNIGQASRIAGITPAAISLLLVHLRKLRRSA